MGEGLVVQSDALELHVFVLLHLYGIEPDFILWQGYDETIEIVQRPFLLFTDILNGRELAVNLFKLVFYGVDVRKFLFEIIPFFLLTILGLLKPVDSGLKIIMQIQTPNREQDHKRSQKKRESRRTGGDRLARPWQEIDV